MSFLLGKAPASSPELHLDVFGDPSGLHGHSELTKNVFTYFLKRSIFFPEKPVLENYIVILNPGSTVTVSLCYPVPNLKCSKKLKMS